MRLIMVGCEYSGTRTLARAIVGWAEDAMDAFSGVPVEYQIHDHFRIPHIGHPPGLTEQEQRQVLALSPRVKEMVQRHNIYYHIPFATQASDSLVIGLHIEDMVYGPLYFGYLESPDPADPIMVTRGMFEQWLVDFAPETVLVMVTASPEVIRRRMQEGPHHNGVLLDGDVEYVLRRFEEEYKNSRLPNKLTIDTSTSTVEESMVEFVRGVEPFLTDADRRRIAEKARVSQGRA